MAISDSNTPTQSPAESPPDVERLVTAHRAIHEAWVRIAFSVTAIQKYNWVEADDGEMDTIVGILAESIQRDCSVIGNALEDSADIFSERGHVDFVEAYNFYQSSNWEEPYFQRAKAERALEETAH